MTTKRVTLSVPADVAKRMKKAAGTKQSVSAWATHAIEKALDEEELRQRFLAWCDGLEATPDQTAKAHEIVGRIVRSPRRRRGKSAA